MLSKGQVGGTFTSQLDRKIFGPFLLNASTGQIASVIAILRIVFGLGVVHRYADQLGFAAIGGDPDYLRFAYSLAVILGLCIASGVLTPIALVAFIFLFSLNRPGSPTLGDQLLGLNSWVILLSAGGLKWGVDGLLARTPAFRPLYRWIYVLGRVPTPENFAVIRFIALFAFWGVCIAAGSFHLFSELWREGKALQVGLTTPYFSDFADVLVRFREASPGLFDILLALALYVQWTWELFLIPCMYLGWPTRLFVAFQGTGFFIASITLMNLGYLPVNELILWGLLFGPQLAGAIGPRWSETPAYEILREGRGLIDRLAAIFVLVVIVFNIMNLIENLDGRPPAPFRTRYWDHVHRLFGQEKVNVMGERVFLSGNAHAVIAELDAEGHPCRIVPYQDLRGGRLDYLRNDLLYFHYSLPWQKAQPKLIKEKHLLDEDSRTRNLIDRVVRLDTLLVDPDRPRTYRVYSFRQPLIEAMPNWYWGKSELVAMIDIESNLELVDPTRRDLSYSYNLPPGHWRSGFRQAETLAFVLSLEEPSPPPALVQLGKPYEPNPTWIENHRRLFFMGTDAE